MKIAGCDRYPRQQTTAMVDTETGDLGDNPRWSDTTLRMSSGNGPKKPNSRHVQKSVTPLSGLPNDDNPKPFIWTARASDISEKVKRTRRALHKRQSTSRSTH